MLPVLSRAQMRAFDREAIDGCHVPGLVLMENAGRGAADCVERLARARPEGRVLVVAGPGNNGGDGFVVARHLAVRGLDVIVVTLAPRAKFTGDALVQYGAFLGIGGAVVEASDAAGLAQLESELVSARVVVDAIFGTGLDRPVGAHHARAIEAMNARPVRSTPVVAIDIPSGLDADTGVPLGLAVQADETITFAHHKLGLLSSEATRYTGRLHVVDIGVPASLYEKVGRSAWLMETADLGALLSPRSPSTHKNGAGNVLAIAGSAGKIGAALLVGRGALKAGAGLVTIATWPDAVAALESRVLEIMTARIDPARIAESAELALAGRRAVAIGSGLGLDEAAKILVEHVVLGWSGPKVVDADALTLFAGRPEAIAAARGGVVLTPHPGEAARLLGCRAEDIERNRFAAARDLASRSGSVVVLKGAHTIVADGTRSQPDAIQEPSSVDLWIQPTANPVLATAGSGDVLSGITAAFLAQLSPFDAARAAVSVHAMAGDRWRARTSADRGLLAGEIADEIPGVLGSLGLAAGAAGLAKLPV